MSSDCLIMIISPCAIVWQLNRPQIHFHHILSFKMSINMCHIGVGQHVDICRNSSLQYHLKRHEILIHIWIHNFRIRAPHICSLTSSSSREFPSRDINWSHIERHGDWAREGSERLVVAESGPACWWRVRTRDWELKRLKWQLHQVCQNLTT